MNKLILALLFAAVMLIAGIVIVLLGAGLLLIQGDVSQVCLRGIAHKTIIDDL